MNRKEFFGLILGIFLGSKHIVAAKKPIPKIPKYTVGIWYSQEEDIIYSKWST